MEDNEFKIKQFAIYLRNTTRVYDENGHRLNCNKLQQYMRAVFHEVNSGSKSSMRQTYNKIFTTLIDMIDRATQLFDPKTKFKYKKNPTIVRCTISRRTKKSKYRYLAKQNIDALIGQYEYYVTGAVIRWLSNNLEYVEEHTDILGALFNSSRYRTLINTARAIKEHNEMQANL